jgi:MYXO-CTERM domain-containing protein
MLLVGQTQLHAQIDTVIHEIADGDNCGRTNRDAEGRDKKGDNYQACAEHATLAQLADGKSIVMFRLASKDQLNGEPVTDRANLACTSVTLTETGPVTNIDKYVTQNDGNQYRNAHASVAVPIDGGKAVAVFYNYRPNNNTERYVQVFDGQCNSLSAQTRVMQKNNDDVCASAENGSHQVYSDVAGLTRVTATCGGNGNNRDDGWQYSVAFQAQPNGTYTAQKEWDLSIEPNEERTRGTSMVIPEQNLVVTCMSAGNTQPTNKGVRCYGIDTNAAGEQGANANSRLLWRQYVARRDGQIYQTQIKMAQSRSVTNEATITWQTLVKRRRQSKGDASLQMARIAVTREGMDIIALPVTNAFPGGDATHRAMLSVPFGVAGAEQDAIMLVSTSVNGSTNVMANAQMLTWEPTTRQFVRGRTVGLNSAIDNAWISNIYGNNPNTQGRNHIQSRVIENPYFGNPAGWMPEVKSFVATAATPRKMRQGTQIAQDKLAFELALTPIVTAPEVQPQDDPAVPLEPNAEPEPEADPGLDDALTSGPATATSTGGCSTSNSSGFGFLALLGLAFLGATRRRRN